MTELYEVIQQLREQSAGNQRKIRVNSALEVFFGYSKKGKMRLSFLSKQLPPVLRSTRILRIVQNQESVNSYWTSFELEDPSLEDAYCSFCENMISSIIMVEDEASALSILRRRYSTWKALFRGDLTQRLSKERIIGLLGELIVLYEEIAPTYGLSIAIQSWGGPDMNSKDFTLNNDWYEVKTIGSSRDTIDINSITQLSSDFSGHLFVLRLESVTREFIGNSISIRDIVNAILLAINNDETEASFVSKLESCGFDMLSDETGERFNIIAKLKYRVDDRFPRITTALIARPEIVSVKYSLSISSLEPFKESLND